jgi:hypothetical protein
VHPPDPAPQMALVCETCADRDFGKPALAAARKFERALQPQMHDVAVRTNPDGSAEDTGKVEWASSRYFCERGHFDRLANVGDDVVSKSRQHLLPQGTAYLRLRARRMTCHQTVDESAGQFIPEQGPVGVVTPALRDQRVCNTEKLWVAAGQSLDQFSFEGRNFRGRERQRGSTAMRTASTLPLASAAQSTPAGQTAKEPAGGSWRRVRPPMRQSKHACASWKQMKCRRTVPLRWSPSRNRIKRMETPLSPGALPATSVVGRLPSSCAKASSLSQLTIGFSKRYQVVAGPPVVGSVTMRDGAKCQFLCPRAVVRRIAMSSGVRPNSTSRASSTAVSHARMRCLAGSSRDRKRSLRTRRDLGAGIGRDAATSFCRNRTVILTTLVLLHGERRAAIARRK